MAEVIIVDAECIEATAADIQHFERGRIYPIDMAWAKARGIWPYFRPIREIPGKEVEERAREDLALEAQGRVPLGGTRAQRAAAAAAG